MLPNLIVDLNDFEIVEKLGEGGNGRVLLIQEKQTDKFFAAKVTKFKCDTQQQQKQFFSELSAYLKVKHPAILSLYGFNMKDFEQEAYPTIIMEYMPEGSLDEVINNESELSFANKYIILLGIAEGMQYLHEHNIIHRDLKPGNILLDEKLYPYICDFGLSKISDLSASSILADSNVGTPLYMAPEIFLDKPYTYKVDVFSFSILAYEIISGKKPYPQAKTVYNLQYSVKNGKRPDLTVIKDHEIKELLTACWSLDPDKRPTFKEIIAEIKKESFKEAMNVNDDDEVKKYIHYVENCSSRDEMIENEEIDSSLYYKMKADKGDLKFILKYAKFLQNEKNKEEESAHYYKMAADKGDEAAASFYASLLYKGIGVKVNKSEAARYYKISADKGNIESMYNYAKMLYEGDGIEIDKQESSKYFKLASDKGNEKAMVKYAEMLLNGDGVEMDEFEAAHLFKVGIKRSNIESMFHFAKMLLEGKSIAINKVEAARYFKLAANNGHVDSMYCYAKMLLDGNGIDINIIEAARYFKMAADKGHIDSMDCYAKMLLDGNGIDINWPESDRYTKMKCIESAMNSKKLNSIILSVDEKNKINDFLNKMRNIQINILDYISDESDNDEKFENIMKLLDKIHENKYELKSLLFLIVNISNNQYRTANFFSKIERILIVFKDYFKMYFSNSEIFHIFKSNKRILLFLLENDLMIIDEFITKRIITDKYLEMNYPQYFYPEIEQHMNEKWFPIKDFSIFIDELPENFYEKRKIGENDNHICELIRKDSIDEFIQYANKSLQSLQTTINQSIYETNNFLLKKEEVTLIEYAAFCGSIRIFNYLKLNDIELTESLWSFAIHSHNYEIIQVLENNNINPVESYEKIFVESIKCHHNDIAYYIQSCYLQNLDQNLNYFLIKSLKYSNYIFIRNDKINGSSFYYLCKYDFYFLAVIIYEKMKNEINDVIIYILCLIEFQIKKYFNEISKIYILI